MLPRANQLSLAHSSQLYQFGVIDDAFELILRLHKLHHLLFVGIKAKSYNYLCVSRTRLKEYTLREEHKCVVVQDSSKREVKLREVHTVYFLEITSPSKAMTEASMNRQWRSRFEAELI